MISFAPYHFYNNAVSTGMKSSLLTISESSAYIRKGSYYSLSKMDGLSGESKKLWEKFHFNNFEIPLPVRHPMIEMIPIIERRKNRPILGASFKIRNKQSIGSFKVMESFKFNRKIKNGKLFELPFFKNYLLLIEDKRLWKDLFTKDIKLPTGSFLEKSYWDSLWEISYQELVYNLYILSLRKDFLPENAREISYFTNKGFGVVELINIDKEDLGLEEIYRKELIYVYDKGFVHKFLVSSRFENIISESIRIKLMNQLTYRPSEESSSIEIYARYKELPYRRRITQEGLTFLFASWSHVTGKKEFIKEMIQFLERGSMGYEVLAPLYNYSYRVFGTNYSIIRNNLKENAAEQLKRKIREEEEAERKKIQDLSEGQVEVEGDFESEEDKVKFYLKKAKESGSIEEENMLIKD